MKANDQREMDVDQLTILSRQTSIRGGVFEVAHDITVRGTLEGDVKVGGRIDVLQGAELLGSLLAKEAIIAGTIRGDLEVEGMVTLRSSAVVEGTIRAGAIAVEEGATGGLVVAAGPGASTSGRDERRGRARTELREALARARTAVASARGVTVEDDAPRRKAWHSESAVQPSEEMGRPGRTASTDELLESEEMSRFLSQRPDPHDAMKPSDRVGAKEEHAD
ncbi:MAG: polymer-forming cytoskeletal protein [Rhodothermia bacterium]|nr:polymer-forming cytoskeletal protein [Rhodothermia bacterium]